MSCTLEQAITPEERLALRVLARSFARITAPPPETHGVVLLSTRDSIQPLPVVSVSQVNRDE